MDNRRYFAYATKSMPEDILGAVLEGIIFIDSSRTMEENTYYLNLLNEAMDNGLDHGYLCECEEGLVIKQWVELKNEY